MFAYSWAESDYDDYDHDDYANDEYADDKGTALSWQDAACSDGSGLLTELFFSDEIPDIELAKAICSTCPLAGPCLRGALERREPAGVWGGQLFADGAVVAFKRKRGRPPKIAAGAPPQTVKIESSHWFELVEQRLKSA